MKKSMMLTLALAASIAVISAACAKDSPNNAAANNAANANV